jgi:hypothetical protein
MYERPNWQRKGVDVEIDKTKETRLLEQEG